YTVRQNQNGSIDIIIKNVTFYEENRYSCDYWLEKEK
ncbi:hypothetical protein QQQ_3036, partial [Clostridioides difficile P5]